MSGNERVSGSHNVTAFAPSHLPIVRGGVEFPDGSGKGGFNGFLRCGFGFHGVGLLASVLTACNRLSISM